jgi:hypothetical protein
MKTFTAQTALDLIDRDFANTDGLLERLDDKRRTKTQFFEVRATKKQLAVIVGDMGPTGLWKPKQARILLEDLPESLPDVIPLPLEKPAKSSGANRRFSRLVAPRQRSVRVESELGLRQLLNWYVKLPATGPVSPESNNSISDSSSVSMLTRPDENHTQPTSDSGGTGEPASRPSISEEDLLAQLARNAQIGRTGELAVFEIECERIRGMGCVDPRRYVLRYFETDVGRGYDLETIWPGAERCIEVKSTSRAGSDLFLTANECKVLESLGERAWLYRMLVTQDEARPLGDPIQDPVPKLRAAGMSVVLWRVQDPSDAPQ